MTTLHLQPENAHSASLSLRQNNDLLAAYLQELNSAIRRLDSAWQGGGKDAYTAEMTSLLRALNSQQEELSLLMARLEREVSEWEQTDEHGASGWQEGQWSAAWLARQMPSAAGSSGFTGQALTSILPLMTAVSIGDLLTGIPAWLKSLLDRLFPPATILSPVPEGPAASEPDTVQQISVGKFPSQTPSTEPPTPVASTSAAAAVPPQAPAEKKYDLLYDVPAKSQGDLYGSAACAPTSVSMVLDFFHARDDKNLTISSDKLISMMDKGDGTPGQGVSLSNLTDELNDLGYNNITTKVNASLDDLKSQLQSGPVVVTTGVKIVGPGTVASSVPRAVTGPGSTIHAMVVKGIGSEGVLVNDPWSGSEMQITSETFSKMWSNGSGGMYTIRP